MNKYNFYKRDLLGQMTRLKTTKRIDAFLADLLTPGEYRDIVFRWQIVKQLFCGTPQRNIVKNLNVSIAKITRGSRVLLDGSGAFARILNKKK